MMRKLTIALIIMTGVSLALSQTTLAQPKPEQTQQPKQQQPKQNEPAAGVDKQTVKFNTSDDVKIAADYYAPPVKPGDKAPVAILVHMYPADRTSWEPLLPRLTEAGFAVLVYDIRGNGGSTEPADKKLKQMYQDRDPALFKDAWKDAEAAKKWLATKPECDVNRIAMIGASIGCSISLEYGSKDPAVKAIVCLSPGTKYFDVDSVAHIKKCGKRAILLMSPKTEQDEVKKLVKASGDVAKGEEYPGSHEQHGTGMLLAPYGDKVKRRIVEFISGANGEKSPEAEAPGPKKKGM